MTKYFCHRGARTDRLTCSEELSPLCPCMKMTKYLCNRGVRIETLKKKQKKCAATAAHHMPFSLSRLAGILAYILFSLRRSLHACLQVAAAQTSIISKSDPLWGELVLAYFERSVPLFQNKVLVKYTRVDCLVVGQCLLPLLRWIAGSSRRLKTRTNYCGDACPSIADKSPSREA